VLPTWLAIVPSTGAADRRWLGGKHRRAGAVAE
jgi:hypothetical protein